MDQPFIVYPTAPKTKDDWGFCQKPPSKYKWMSSICALIHILLVALHIVLLIICVHHYEHAITTDVSPFTTNWAPLVINVVLQVVATLYLALLVLVTQRLALRRDLLTRQTLTSIHDKGNAWLGIGSALTSVWQQSRLPAAPFGVTSIALYLAGVSTVHVTMTNLFHIIPYNATVSTTHSTTLANASFTTGEVSSYDILLFYDQFTTLGLVDNMLYDVIPSVTSATGTTVVNASVYNVECAALPQAYDVEYEVPNMDPVDPIPSTMFFVDDVITANVPISYYPAVYSASIATMNASCGSSGCIKPLIMAATVPIIDSSGAEAPGDPGPWKYISPRILQPLNVGVDDNATSALITGIQLVACGITIVDQQINISAETRQPVPSSQSTVNTEWKNWTWPESLATSDSRLLAAQEMPDFSPASGHSGMITIRLATVNSTNATAPIMIPGVDPTDPLAMQVISSGWSTTLTPSAFDVFITEDVGLSSGGSNVSLSDLNRSLGRALAAISWYGSNIDYSNVHAASSVVLNNLSTPVVVGTNPNLVRNQGEAIILIQALRYRLNLNTVSVAIGLGVSSALLFLSFILIGQPLFSRDLIHSHTVLEGSGVLQLTWLLGNEPHLLRVGNPEVQALRTAGMFDVQMNDRAKEKALRALAGDEVDEIDNFMHSREPSV